MVATDRVIFLFSEARALHEDALGMLAQGRVRDAAENAWGATMWATNALLLARTGEEPERTAEDGSRTPATGVTGRNRAGGPPVEPLPRPAGRPPRGVFLQRVVRAPG